MSSAPILKEWIPFSLPMIEVESFHILLAFLRIIEENEL
jgi:hypothetical protein